MYDLVITTGGTLVDPATGGSSERKDIAVSRGKVVEVADSISSSDAKQEIDASGKVVAPGFVDIHAHVAHDITKLSIDPEEFCLPNGVTTVSDAGSTGELNFRGFKKYVIDRCQTRITAFVNVESLGMVEFDASPSNTDQRWPMLITAADDTLAPLFVNRKNLLSVLRGSKGTIAGLKWAHHGIKLLEITRQIADEAQCRVMAENHFMPEALRYLKKGDIITHAYHFHTNRVNNRRDGLTEDGKTIHPRDLPGQEAGRPSRRRSRQGEFHLARGRAGS